MTIPLHNFLETVSNPEERFRSLAGIYPVLGPQRQVLFSAGPASYRFEMVYGGERITVRCIHTAAPTHGRKSGRLLEREMLVFDRNNNPVWFDVEILPSAEEEDIVTGEDEYWIESHDNQSPVFYGSYSVGGTEAGFGLLGPGGDFMIPPVYEDMEWDPDSGIAKVMVDGKWGLMTPDGKYVVRPAFQWLGLCDSGLMPACYNDSYGYIRPDGSVAIGFLYDDAYSFCNGRARVCAGGEEFEIDTAGNRTHRVF